MASASVGLAPSVKKDELWRRLGIRADADHRLMLNEAAAGRERLSYNRDNLTNLSKTDPRVRAPYAWDQLSETAKHREILNIFAMASPRSRIFYERARIMSPVAQDQVIEENWAIRWFLWHSFRYRDNRKDENRGPRAGQAYGSAPNRYYDPARSQWLAHP